jgi:hypothetical protein
MVFYHKIERVNNLLFWFTRAVTLLLTPRNAMQPHPCPLSWTGEGAVKKKVGGTAPPFKSISPSHIRGRTENLTSLPFLIELPRKRLREE